MKSKYLLATLAGFFMTNVTASSSTNARIDKLAAEFEGAYYGKQERIERKRSKEATRLELIAERKAALAALAAKSVRKEKQAKISVTKPASPTSPKTPAPKAEEAKAVSPKKT